MVPNDFPPRSTDPSLGTTPDEWPAFGLVYAYGPDLPERGRGDDDVVIYDPIDGPDGERWIAASSGSYDSVERVR